jgi:hypothetical protein
MKTTYGLSVFAALSLVGAAYAQTETTPKNVPSTSVMHPTPNPELDGASTAPRKNSMRMAAAAPGAIPTGMQVRSETGDLLGNVASNVPANSDSGANKGANHEGYVVIASPNGVATPVPYSAAKAMVQNDTVVVNKTRFEQAPKVQQYQSEDRSRPAWQAKADSYWKHYAMSPEQPSGARR